MKRIFGFPHRLAATLLLAACVAGANMALAQGSPFQGIHFQGVSFQGVKIQSPFQWVEVDGIQFGFEARIAFCADHQPAARTRGFGFVEFTSSDGDVLRLIPVWGTVDRQTGGVVLTFTPVVNRQIGPEDLVVAVVQPASSDPGCLIWDFAGTEPLSKALPPPFDAEGTFTQSRRGEECEPVDYGQLDAWVSIETPLQQVEPLPPSNIVGFEAQIRLNRHQAAQGFLDVHLPGETVSYEPIFGALFPGDDAFLTRGVVILLRRDLNAPHTRLNTDDHVLRATVSVPAPAPNPPSPPPTPTPPPTNPDELIWDLINGESGRVNGLFDALGNISVRLPAARAGIRQEMLNNKYSENMSRGR